jgi:hypothetical protein
MMVSVMWVSMRIPAFALGIVTVATDTGAELTEAHAGKGAHDPVLIGLRPAPAFHAQRLFKDLCHGHAILLSCGVFEIAADRIIPGIALVSVCLLFCGQGLQALIV